MKYILLLMIFIYQLYANTLQPLDFEIDKKEIDSTPTLLLIGGIQGDEPGGFNATNVFLMRYKILNGSVWVVPVLNRHSMLLNDRGIYDDMNRKFAHIAPNDPEKFIIEHIKETIKSPQVSAILHLHDGSGYFRATYQSALLNPNRWGNCTVIDQDTLEGVKYGELLQNATFIINRINTHLLKPIHQYHTHNTQTALKDKEMQKALTFYAINQQKAAYANEASKELNVQERVYYHLLAIEAMLDIMGIQFERDFELSPSGVYKVINDTSLDFSFEGKMPHFPLFGLRDTIANFPYPKDKDPLQIAIDSRARILGTLPKNNTLSLKYGNRVMTKFTPKYIQFDDSLESINATIDSSEQTIKLGSIVSLKNAIEFQNIQGYTIKVIGLNNNAKPISKANLSHQASIDKAGNLYRVEIYRQIPLAPNTQDSKEAQSLESHNMDSAKADSSLESSVDTPKKAKVIVSSANVRALPSLEAEIVAKSPMGRELFVLDSADGWAKIQYNFKERVIQGYIFERLLGYENPTPTKPQPKPQAPKTQELFSGMIVLDFTQGE